MKRSEWRTLKEGSQQIAELARNLGASDVADTHELIVAKADAELARPKKARAKRGRR